MIFKKSSNKIFGVILNNSEEKALQTEIRRQLAEYARLHHMEVDALMLWELHEQLGFSVKRLKRFYENFSPKLSELAARYEMDTDEDGDWLCTQKLKEIGIDLEEWSKEITNG